MSNLNDNELSALIYYGIGVGTEGGDSAYQLSFCGENTQQAGVLQPIGNSGYAIGEMQSDLGSQQSIANALVDKFEEWAKFNHPDWSLKGKIDQFKSDLARDGNHIRDTNYDLDNARYKQSHHGQSIPKTELSKTGPDIDRTFKEHLNAYLATNQGKSFVHQQDVKQINDIMLGVASRLKNTNLYKSSLTGDQAKLFSVVGKLYNQGPVYANKILTELEQGQLKSYDEVSAKISSFIARDPYHPDRPTYLESGRDAAVAGAVLFNALQNANERNAIHEPWQAVIGNPLVDPTKLGQDPNLPHLPDQYATIKAAFVQPAQGHAMVNALTSSASYTYGDPTNDHSRGFYAEGNDFLQWDRDGHGRAFINGQWSDLTRDELSLKRNKDHTLDVHLTRDGTTQNLLHVMHPTVHEHVANHPATTHEPRAILHQGMHGDDVKRLQDELARLGYTDAKGHALNPDKDYGKNTRHAVEDFQRDFHLTPNGEVNAKTQETLEAAIKESERATDMLSKSPKSPADISALQQYLQTLGMTDHRGRPFPVTGIYDDLTCTAVSVFQQEQGLPVTGQPDPGTCALAKAHAMIADLKRDVPEHTVPMDVTQHSNVARTPLPPSVDKAHEPTHTAAHTRGNDTSRTPSITPTDDRDDPRNENSPQHALYETLKARIPEASEKRLLQFTAACHAHHIGADNLDEIQFDRVNGRMAFTPSWPPGPTAVVDLTKPSPEPQQSIQQIQQTDHQHAQMMADIQARAHAQMQHGLGR